MSRRGKSDAQLDAEAAARRVTPERNGLLLLRTYRVRFAAETPLRLAAGRPPMLREHPPKRMADEPAPIVFLEEEPAAALGMTLAGPFLRLLEHPFGIRRALTRWERYCRAKHARWPDHTERPVCAELAWMMVRDRYGLKGASDELGISYPRAARLLAEALRKMHVWLSAEERSALLGHDRDACPTCRLEATG